MEKLILKNRKNLCKIGKWKSGENYMEIKGKSCEMDQKESKKIQTKFSI